MGQRRLLDPADRRDRRVATSPDCLPWRRRFAAGYAPVMGVNVHLRVGDCLEHLGELRDRYEVALTFLDPPFNQGKEYQFFDDDLDERAYWTWMRQVCAEVHRLTVDGGSVYFMQREKNAEQVLACLRETGWTFQNLIVWMKKASAVPSGARFGKQYQVIAFATKGPRARTFNRLRIDAPLRPEHRQARKNGIFVTDCWDDIRELTSGYFAGPEALRSPSGDRLHKQQSPVALLCRILLASSVPGDWVLDPFGGTGTTAVVAKQLSRNCVTIEVDPQNAVLIEHRVSRLRAADRIGPLRHYYRFTPNLDVVWPSAVEVEAHMGEQNTLFEPRPAYGDL